MNAWLCANVYMGLQPMNNSSSQGWLIYSYPGVNWDLTTSVVNAVTQCDGNEGVIGADAIGPDGRGGLKDVTDDMILHCTHHGN
jgi:hypothetical protein